MKLQDRDKEILKLCYEQQFLLSEHVCEYFFAGNYTETKRRLRELKAADLLKSYPVPKSNRRIFQLTWQGRKVGRELSRMELDRPRRPFDSQLEHDALVTSVRLRLELLWEGVWIPELAIRKLEIQEVPDGLFVFTNGTKAAIEIENSLKGRSRFVNRMKSWRDVKVRLVLYVVAKAGILERIKYFMSEAPSTPLFGIVPWEELKGTRPVAWSPQGELELTKEKDL
ncbi:MAG: replication-relaxation family protein [Oligoflexia bacterium]|nr:replication-relaxation family protein [Oligoflexia bacterium]